MPPPIPRPLALALALALLGGWGAGGCDASSEVHPYNDVEELPDGSRVTTGVEWTYRSFDVDVDLRVETVEEGVACATWAWLAVDKANASERRHAMNGMPCDALRLTPGGDILIDGVPSGIDWTQERLRVDEDAEVLWLGPALPPGGLESDAVTLQVLVDACQDDGACECGVLRRLSGAESRAIELSRTCP